jgi:hypothetical protein
LVAAWGVWIFAAVLLATVVGSLVYASQGTPDPTEARTTESHAVVVANSAIIVFREGLEAVLILAAVMAPMLGVQKGLRRPVAAGAATAFAAAVGTWFVAQAVLAQFARYGDRLQAVTGLLAIAVLLVVMNWFFHKVYWTKWIGSRNAQRKRVLARRRLACSSPTGGPAGSKLCPRGRRLGLQAFAAVLVVGSYFAAEYLKVRKPRRRGEEPAVRASEPALLQSQ